MPCDTYLHSAAKQRRSAAVRHMPAHALGGPQRVGAIKRPIGLRHTNRDEVSGIVSLIPECVNFHGFYAHGLTVFLLRSRQTRGRRKRCPYDDVGPNRLRVSPLHLNSHLLILFSLLRLLVLPLLPFGFHFIPDVSVGGVGQPASGRASGCKWPNSSNSSPSRFERSTHGHGCSEPQRRARRPAQRLFQRLTAGSRQRCCTRLDS